jgi:transposase
MQTLHIGVDAAKDSVWAAESDEDAKPREIRNQRGALLGWLRTLPPGTRIAVESTGHYHQLLVDLAIGCGLVVYVLNPKAVRYYAKGLLIRGKTDRVDARVIARYLAKEHESLHPYVPPTPEQRQLAELVRRRATLVRSRVAVRSSMENFAFAQDQVKAVIKQIGRLIAKLDARRNELVQSCPKRKAAYQRFQQISGIGPVVAAGLIQVLDRIPFRSSDAFIAYTGLDPRPQDSGRKVGRRRLSKQGPSELRRLLHTAAMSASKSPLWRKIYQRHRDAGWSGTASLVILARKLARIAWSMHRYQKDFNPALVS